MYYCLNHCKNRKDERKTGSGWDVDCVAVPIFELVPVRCPRVVNFPCKYQPHLKRNELVYKIFLIIDCSFIVWLLWGHKFRIHEITWITNCMGDSTPPEIAEASIEYCSAVSKFSMIFFFSLEVGPFICAIVADWRFLSFFLLLIKVVEILLPMDLIRPSLPKRLERDT